FHLRQLLLHLEQVKIVFPSPHLILLDFSNLMNNLNFVSLIQQSLLHHQSIINYFYILVSTNLPMKLSPLLESFYHYTQSLVSPKNKEQNIGYLDQKANQENLQSNDSCRQSLSDLVYAINLHQSFAQSYIHLESRYRMQFLL